MPMTRALDTTTLVFAASVNYNHLPLSVAIILMLIFSVSCQTPKPLVIPVKPISTDVAQKLDQDVRVLVDAARSKDPSAVAQAADERKIPLEKGFVRLQITADKEENVTLIERWIASAGGRVITHFRVVVFAVLPPSAIEGIAAHPETWNITLTPRAAAMQD
jgi:hypothetical protein